MTNYWALANGPTEAFREYLMKRPGTFFGFFGGGFWSPIEYVAMNGSVENLRFLLNLKRFSIWDNPVKHLLPLVIRRRRAKHVRLLLERGADPYDPVWDSYRILPICVLMDDPVLFDTYCWWITSKAFRFPGAEVDAELTPYLRQIRRDRMTMRFVLPLVDPGKKARRSTMYRASRLRRLPWHVAAHVIRFVAPSLIREDWGTREYTQLEPCPCSISSRPGTWRD